MRYFCIAVFCLVVFFSGPLVQANENKPNFLFILVDDLGWGDLGCYGNKRHRTPCLDNLASEGIVFTQYYQGGSVCSPSRACLMTSRWPAELKIHAHYATPGQNQGRGMENFLNPAEATLPRLLQQSGYRTIHIGKWHLGEPNENESGTKALQCYGFDESHWVEAVGKIDGLPVNLWTAQYRPIASKVLVDTGRALETASKS